MMWKVGTLQTVVNESLCHFHHRNVSLFVTDTSDQLKIDLGAYVLFVKILIVNINNPS